MFLQSLGNITRGSAHIKFIFIFSGFFLISLAFLICFKMLNFEIDWFHRSFKNIRFFRLKNNSLTDEERDEIVEVMDHIDDAEPISGCGMFEIRRSTLTSMLSTSITYLIILIQFKLSF